MTTNHKPTLESRRGREQQETSIIHARSLPSHKELKFRDAKVRYEELKQELLESEQKAKKDPGQGEPAARKVDTIQAGEPGSADESASGSGSDEESESDSEDDEELMKELAKIKAERAQTKQKEQEKLAIESNPLLNPNKPIRKNWRQDRVFKKRPNNTSSANSQNFINDLTQNKNHKDFLNKFFK